MITYDPLSASSVANPYPTYAALRATAPVSWSERLNAWVLVKYRDCHRVLNDSDLFASDWRRAGHDGPAIVQSMQGLDPPEQLPMRRIFTTALRDQDLGDIGQKAVAEAAEFLDRAARQPTFDFTIEVARPVGLNAVSRLLGLEPPPESSFASLVDATVRGLDAGLLPQLRGPAAAARQQLNELVRVWFAADGTSGIINQTLAAAPAVSIPADTIWNSARVLFLAGYSTSVAAGANAALALASHPGAIARLRGLSRLDSAADELMRFDAPVQGTTRAVVRPTTISDTTIQRGDLVLTLFGAANRDPEQFPDPDSLIFDRSPNRHLSLGWGAHYCIGALLAKIIVGALVTAIVRANGLLELATEPTRLTRATMRYPDTLPVTLSQGRRRSTSSAQRPSRPLGIGSGH